MGSYIGDLMYFFFETTSTSPLKKKKYVYIYISPTRVPAPALESRIFGAKAGYVMVLLGRYFFKRFQFQDIEMMKEKIWGD